MACGEGETENIDPKAGTEAWDKEGDGRGTKIAKSRKKGLY
jgi:hypothetical protein